MELAIPLIALGGMYVVSNQKPSRECNNQNQNKNFQSRKMNQENFTNMGAKPNYLPNTNIPPQNFPVSNINQLVDTVQEYPNPNAATDKYFDQNNYEKRVNQGKSVGQNPQQIYSISGNYLDSAQFKHNNMVPFNGGKVKGNTYRANIAESVLDNTEAKEEEIPDCFVSNRQKKILEFLGKNEKAQVMDLQTILPDITKRTIRRDLDELLEAGKIARFGDFNQVFYKISEAGHR